MADAEVELQQIGLYTITSLLHTGSASHLYTGKHRKKDIAIKVFRTPLFTEEAKEAFLSRAKQLKKLKHRHILDILDFGLTQHFGTSDDYGFLVMQYAAGETLRQRIAPGKHLTAPEVRPLLSPVATALHYAHVSHIIHGNLHPGNLLYDAHNDILVSDFSLPFADNLATLHTGTSAIPYMAPEQLQGHPIPASDQYALAVIVYEWLCGQRPYAATERETLLHQQTHEPLPPPTSLNTNISPTVERVLLQALASDPDDRFPHIQAFADNYLRALMGQPLQLEKKQSVSSPKVKLVDNGIPNNNKTKESREDIADKDTLKMVAQQNTSSPSKLTMHEDIEMNNKLEDPAHPTLYCKVCGSANRTNAKYCFSCGQPILNESPLLQISTVANGVGTSNPATLNCITCGATNRANANNCNRCGTPLKITSNVIPPHNTDTLAPNYLLNQRYQIISQLGKGGMGTVYKTKDTKFDGSDRLVAVKALSLSGLSQKEITKATAAFKQEAHMLAGLRHPSLPRIYDHFNEGEHWYLVMDFIDGETLEDYLNRASGRRLPFGKVLYMGIQLCKVLEYLHNHTPPIIFRDLKPLNVMITPDGEYLYLIDFGIARHFKPGKAKDTTPLGTWGYAAPEQAGRSQTTHKSDIYSLGATLHQLLSGDDPAQSPFQFAPLQLESKSAAYDFDKLIIQMLDMDPSKRPDSMTIIKQKLENIYAEWYTTQHSNQGSKQNKLVKASIITTDSQLEKTISDDLRQGGILSQRLPDYEERPAQIEMAALVARSLIQNDPAICEAGTGTGKSLAYLVPIVRSGKVAIISTANKALQEQLFYKDIPFIQKHIQSFDAALVKGIGNYVCIDRLESERVGLQFYAKNREFMRLVDITNDPDSTFMGDFETLDFPLAPDIRSKVCADSDQCAWSKCGYFADCYVRKMRVKAERAQVIVVNHTLLLLDAAMDGYLLPERDVIVLDEAHHLEEEATRCFTVTVSPNSVLTLLAQRTLKDHSLLSLQDEANKALYTAWEQLKLVADPGYKGRANLSSPLEEGLKLATVISDLADSLRKQRPKNLPEKEEQLYDKLLARTQNLAKNIRTVFAVDEPQRFVYYVERTATAGQKGFLLQVSASPLDVTPWLKEKLFDKCNIICTSATLATIGPNAAKPEDKGPNFAYFRRRVGLDPIDYPNVLERILPLTFDYESHALLYLPRDLPAPVFGIGSDDYTKAIAREMYRLVKISRGRAFLLFSSKRMLDQSYELMAPHLEYPLLKQGDMSRLELTRRFREETGAILFGLKSFWEGVDIAGEALSLVVIDKLPFDPPDDPVHEARVAQMKAAGENWFGIYVLPQAVLRLKQGLGRLLRTREDRGVMAILDTRLHTKGYGKMVLDALPPARRTASIKDVHGFFNEEDGPF